jgi:hypothetical protein
MKGRSHNIFVLTSCAFGVAEVIPNKKDTLRILSVLFTMLPTLRSHKSGHCKHACKICNNATLSKQVLINM